MKKIKLQQLIFDVNDKHEFTPMCRIIMDGIETLNEFKSTLVWYANMHDTIYCQREKFFQYHHGKRYCMDIEQMYDLNHAINRLADYMGYVVDYYDNGSRFITTKNGK